jgi:hypothetical protein
MWRLTEREPSLEELLGDEMMSLVMRSAGLDQVGLRTMLADVANRLPLRTRGEIIESGGCEQRKVRITISIGHGGA